MAEVLSQVNDDAVIKDEESLELTLNERLKQANPEFPHVELVFYFGSHFTEADVEGMKPILDISDIFFPEIVGYSDGDLTLLQQASFGLIPKEDAVNEYPTNSPFYRALISELHNSDKYIGFVDMPKGDPLLEKTIEVMNSNDPMEKGQSLDEAKIRFYEYEKELVKLRLEREQMITERLPKEIINITKKYHNLLKRDKLRCLVFMGTDHNSLYYGNFRNDHEAVPFQEVAEYPGFSSKLMMLISKGKEPGDSLILRAMIEDPLRRSFVPKFRHAGVSGHDLISYIRKSINLFSDQELEDIFKHREEGFMKVWKERLKDKGFDLPETKEDLLKFIGK